MKELPDSRVKDRLLSIQESSLTTIEEIGIYFGASAASAYVVDSVPLSLFAAQQIHQLDFKSILTSLIKVGGDTDTNCSMTGQLLGTLGGIEIIPNEWMHKYEQLNIHESIQSYAKQWKI